LNFLPELYRLIFSPLPVTIPPGQPRGQVHPFGPGGGELFEAVLSQGEGAGQIENNFLSFEVCHFSVDAGPRGEDCLFPRKISRICSRLVREEKSLKIKIRIRMYVYYKLLNECAFDAYSNGWRSPQTKKYFFSVFMYIIERLK